MDSSINTQEHSPALPEEQVMLIDPAKCEEFMTYLNERNQNGEKGHNHDNSHAPNVSWRLITMIVFNGIVFAAELATGYITQSLSLQSDAWHMLSDETSLIIGLVAHRMAKRPPTSKMTFGFARTEVLGGLVNATFLLAVCMMITFDAIGRFLDPPEIQHPLLFLVVGGIGLVTNVIGLLMFSDHNHSDNIKGVFLHVLSDFFGSVGVIGTALLYYFSTWPLKKYADPVFSLLIVLMLIRSSVQLFKKTAMTVAERCPDSVNSDRVAAELMKIEGVVAVHELHIWELSKNCNLSIIHIVIESKERHSEVLEQVHNLMIGYGVYSSTVQIEFADNFPDGIDHLGHCFYASSFGKENRAFLTPPVYRHVVGCPHLNMHNNDAAEDEHLHVHHAHNHNHNHGHKHGKHKSTAEQERPLDVEEDESVQA
jgi:zinc transporter 1